MQTFEPQDPVTQEEPLGELDLPTQLPRGTYVDRFLLVSKIKDDATGVLYRGFDPDAEQRVFVKLIPIPWQGNSKDPISRKSLLDEAQIISQLKHPLIAAVQQVGEVEKDLFIVTQMPPGKSLREWLGDRNQSHQQILAVFLAIGRALSAAHRAGVYHRVFSPDSVYVDEDSQVHLFNFQPASGAGVKKHPSGAQPIVPKNNQTMDTWPGLAKSLQESSDDTLRSEDGNRFVTQRTAQGLSLGVPSYMAPEQHLGMSADASSDQFSFCVSLYEALYGRRPYSAKTLTNLKLEVLQGKFLPPPMDSRTPTRIWPVLIKGLSVAPADRFPAMEMLVKALEHIVTARTRTLLTAGLIAAALGLAAIAAYLS